MSEARPLLEPALPQQEPEHPRSRLQLALWRLEDAGLAVALAGMALLGVVDLEVWRRIGVRIPIRGADELLRHLTLLVGMLGGAVAAREGRLLSVASIAPLLPKRFARALETYSSGIASFVALMLALAAALFVQFERQSGATLAIGIPTVWFEYALPAGFAVIAARLARRAGHSTAGGLVVLALAVALGFALAHLPFAANVLRWPAIAMLLASAVLGAPIFVLLGGAALVLFFTQGDPIASIPLDHYDQVTNPLLATLPLFTLTGYLLAESGASQRLVRLFTAWTGHWRGGAAVATVLGCAFFTAFTGGSGVTILALGGLLMPVLAAAGYGERPALGMMTGAGSLGVLLPPCLPLVLYSIIGQVSLEQMFVGGLLPSLVLMGFAIAWGVWAAPARTAQQRFDAREAWRATWDAKWELLLPVIPLVLIFGGYALPVQAAALTALYAFVIETFVHDDLRRNGRLLPLAVECGVLVGGVLLILGAAMGFTNWLVTGHVPDDLAAAFSSHISQPWVFLLLLNAFLIVVGCLMDIFSAIIVVAPLIVPLGQVFGIDPVHLGVIFLANLELGYLTPPVGLNLFLAAYRFDKPLLEVARATMPMMLVLLAAVIVITYVPAISTWLPSLLLAR
jgi:tripartite ATP-independent transporter DctM subunit